METARPVPEGDDQSGPSAHPTERLTCIMAQLPKRGGAKVRQLVLFPVRPQILDQVQFRRIGRKKLQPQASLSAAGRSPTPRGCDDRAARPRRSASPECAVADERETQRFAGCGLRRETAGSRSSTRSRPPSPRYHLPVESDIVSLAFVRAAPRCGSAAAALRPARHEAVTLSGLQAAKDLCSLNSKYHFYPFAGGQPPMTILLDAFRQILHPGGAKPASIHAAV